MATLDGSVPAQFTAHVVANGQWFVVVNDAPVKLSAHIAPDGSRFVAVMDGLELADADGSPFTAIVEGLQLEGSGSTPAAAQDTLIQAMRSWLERQDTAGKLAETLGIDHLDEADEVILQFLDQTEADRRRTNGIVKRPPNEVQLVEWNEADRTSIRTFRG